MSSLKQKLCCNSSSAVLQSLVVYSIPVCLVGVVNKRLSLPPTGRIIVVATTSNSSRTPIQKKNEVVEITLCNLSDPVNKITIEALLTDVISKTPFRMTAKKLKKSLT
ncbi:hypothetical protein TNCV_2371701 [Trichonephila clavipes]|nr:hypothetical protein TNCV_2371701 [Trichonephila clavipes]